MQLSRNLRPYQKMGKGNLGVKVGSYKLWLVNSFEFFGHAGSHHFNRAVPGRDIGYCQLGVVGLRFGWFAIDLRIHQAHVTSCQTRKERFRKRRWLTDRSRWRPSWKRFWITPSTDQNRCV